MYVCKMQIFPISPAVSAFFCPVPVLTVDMSQNVAMQFWFSRIHLEMYSEVQYLQTLCDITVL